MLDQAEEITLTIGQAFDLAYKRFLEKSAKDGNKAKQNLLLQKKVGQCPPARGACLSLCVYTYAYVSRLGAAADAGEPAVEVTCCRLGANCRPEAAAGARSTNTERRHCQCT